MDDARFDGTIPEVYDRFLGPLLFEPYAIDLAERVATCEPASVLEIAAGTGIVSRRLLEVLPPGSRLTVTDLNEPMLEQARLKIGADPRVTFRQADALELPFADGEFDALVCQFGLMFFPDKPKAMREFHRVLSPGGRLIYSVWDSLEHNAHGRVSHAAIAEIIPDDPPAFYEVPFSFHDVPAIRTLTNSAGFTEVEILPLEFTGESPTAADTARGLVRGNPVVHEILARAPQRLGDIEALAAKRLADDYGDNPLRIRMRALVVSAVKPT